MKCTSWALVAAAAGALFVSGVVSAHDRITTKVTWTRDISRIVQARCIRCHVEEGPGPMPLTTYEEARPWATAIREEVLARRMPKWHAARGYGDFANDPSLSASEIAMIAAWVDGGAPLGNQPSNTDSTGTADAHPQFRPPYRPDQIRSLTFPCGSQPLSGRLLAVQPTLQRDTSAGIAAVFPNGRRQIVAWVRNYEPDFPTTYWLRTPLDLPPGSRLVVEATGGCRLTVSLQKEKGRIRAMTPGRRTTP